MFAIRHPPSSQEVHDTTTIDCRIVAKRLTYGVNMMTTRRGGIQPSRRILCKSAANRASDRIGSKNQ
jgi:hypothetical protein